MRTNSPDMVAELGLIRAALRIGGYCSRSVVFEEESVSYLQQRCQPKSRSQRWWLKTKNLKIEARRRAEMDELRGGIAQLSTALRRRRPGKRNLLDRRHSGTLQTFSGRELDFLHVRAHAGGLRCFCLGGCADQSCLDSKARKETHKTPTEPDDHRPRSQEHRGPASHRHVFLDRK